VRRLTLMSLVVALLVALFATAAYAKIVTGTNRDDNLKGTAQSDQINGLNGEDSIWGFNGSDDIYGGADEDELYGGRASDYVTGGTDEDELWGGRGPDVLFAHDGYEDDLDCGPGIDYAYVDEGRIEDNVNENCEFVNGTDTR
jgi:Ca2+-binding RTX toxin-like protein